MLRAIPTTLFLASSNAGKLREMTPFAREMFGTDVDFRTQAPPLAAETGHTFLENAFQKAHALEGALRSQGLESFAVLADDSGLAVDALDGRPGIDTALYAGDHVAPELHMRKLLRELAPLGLSLERRTARYHCALALVVIHGGERAELAGEGTCAGLIAEDMSGRSGFGYDPLFFVPDYGCTMAELPEATKQAISHRARAFESLAERFRTWRGA
jgi:XTP/dITP diphosphohydrolase